MRMERAADVSRAVALVTIGGNVYGHCLPHRSVHGLRPRNRNAPGKNRPGNDVNDKNQAEQDKASGPSLTVPIVVRRDGVIVDHDRQAKPWADSSRGSKSDCQRR